MKAERHSFLRSLVVFLVAVSLVVLLRPAETLGSEGQRQPRLLQEYEADYKDYMEIEVGEKKVYYRQRTINGAIVEKDRIIYQFDKDTKHLLAKIVHWRDDLPTRVPQIKVTKQQAESMVPGRILFSKLYIISPESDVFPIEPTPTNPCWAVRSVDVNDGFMRVTVVDAVNGAVLGNGVPPPHAAFSLSGARKPCSCAWTAWYTNAAAWFDAMGYSTEAAKWPAEDEVKARIQSNETALFYEVAHGGSVCFYSGCEDGYFRPIYGIDIQAWLEDCRKMPFTFIGSCEGMCHTGEQRLSYEFRKGSTQDTVTVGYCGMSTTPCDDCWTDSVSWQDAFFAYMNLGWTAKDAFDQAVADYPQCSDCVEFLGDETFSLVPRVKRDPNVTAYYPYPQDRAREVSADVVLHWTRGAGAASHNVYLGTDFSDVNDATADNPLGVYQGNQTQTYFNPAGLDTAATHYWRIDEVAGDGSVVKGYTWRFATITNIVVDDMESYDTGDNRIYDTWLDWWYNWTGSLIGLGAAPDYPVHGGEQSMEFVYDNDCLIFEKYSEAERACADPCNWIASGVKALGLYFYGDPNNDADDTVQMYVGLEDSSAAGGYAEVRYGDNGEDMNDIKIAEWQQWNIAPQRFDEGGVDLTKVAKIYIGFGDRHNPLAGGSGTVYFDDVRLWLSRCLPDSGLAGDLTGDCIINPEDVMVMAEEWLTTGTRADLVQDNNVDFKDFDVLADNWHKDSLWP